MERRISYQIVRAKFPKDGFVGKTYLRGVPYVPDCGQGQNPGVRSKPWPRANPRRPRQSQRRGANPLQTCHQVRQVKLIQIDFSSHLSTNCSMPIEKCSSPGCDYKKGDYQAAQILGALRLHGRLAHPELFGTTTQEPIKREKMKCPVLQMSGQSCEEGIWEFFVQKYNMYARACNIGAGEANDCFRECLPEEVLYMVHSTYGPEVVNQDINTLKANVKALVVMAKSRVT